MRRAPRPPSGWRARCGRGSRRWVGAWRGSLREAASRAVSSAPVAVEMRDVADGLWLWRQPHPDWEEGNDWEPEVTSFAVESRGVSYLIDPLAPPPSAREVWHRIEARPPDGIVILKPDHVRDVDLFVRWYGA